MKQSMLENKSILVVGAGGLLGRMFVESILEAGGRVGAADLRLDRIQTPIHATPRNFCSFNLDIGDPASIRDVLSGIERHFGRLDGVVNTAYPRNSNYGRRFEEVQVSDFCENLSLHLGGYFSLMKEACLFLKAQGGGSFVNLSSIYGLIPPKFELYDGSSFTMPVEYAAIKSGINLLTKYAAKYFKGANIRVNAVCPGGIRNDQESLFQERYDSQCLNKGMLDPVDICGAVMFLLSDASKYMNGQILVVDDGFSL